MTLASRYQPRFAGRVDCDEVVLSTNCNETRVRRPGNLESVSLCLRLTHLMLPK